MRDMLHLHVYGKTWLLRYHKLTYIDAQVALDQIIVNKCSKQF